MIGHVSRILAVAAIATAIGGGAALGLAPGQDHPPIELLGKPRFPIPPAIPSGDDRGYDCLDLTLELNLDFNTETIRGRARHTILSTRTLDTVWLDLVDSLHVTGVWRGAVPLQFQHANRALLIDLAAPVPAKTEIDLVIAYSGHPPRDGLMGFSFQRRNGVPGAYTLSEPKSASAWWPCKDEPDDKLRATVILDIPDTLYAGSNGRLISDEHSSARRRRMTWREEFPIAPYLLSVACSKYAVFGDTHAGPGGQVLPLLYLAYPDHRENAAESWGRTSQMISAFESRFGPYPFYGEKYGMAEFPWGGAMENQTLTSYGEYLVDGTDENDWVVAHELAHQWWGDKVTCASWDHIWLNEGFASYCEALWYESIGGIEAYRDWIRHMWWPDFPGRIVPPNYVFNGTVYFKGAWVLHMLRGLLGERIFFAALNLYADRHAYQAATTEDLVAALEEVSGRDLRWFFNEWVYAAGQPTYVMTWSHEPGPDGGLLHVRMEQTQVGQVFRMPVEIEIRDLAGSHRAIIEDSLRVQEFTLPVRSAPTSLRLDPDDWILKDSIGGSDAPSPPGTSLTLGLPHSSPGVPPFRIPLIGGGPDGRVSIYDVSGTRVAEVRRDSSSPWVDWDGRDLQGRPVGSGLFLARASSGGAAVRIWIVR